MRWATAHWTNLSLGRKLFISYLAVVLVGLATVFIVLSAVAPNFFATSMQAMMSGTGMGGMMGGGVGATTTASTASLDAAFHQALMRGLVVATLVATVAAFLASYFVARQIASPIQRMLVATRRIGAGHYNDRVMVPPVDAGDELGQLAASFNAMASALEQTDRHRMELVGDVAHELRTPIATLTGYLEGLLDGVVPSEPETWARLHTESLRLRRLVDDLQELSRAEAHQIPLRIGRVAPSGVLSVARERVAPAFAEKGLELDVAALAAELPAVSADPDRAVQVLTNLLINALRYTPTPGRVEVEVAREGKMVAFRVRDTGIGIAPDHLPHLFERFYRVDKSRARALGGSGIGLTISQALVEAMHGTIRAESAGPGKGSTFTFTLPIAA